MIAFQLLFTSVLGYAHLASQPHDTHHIHSEKSTFANTSSSHRAPIDSTPEIGVFDAYGFSKDTLENGVDSQDHDRTECHSHLFSFVLPSPLVKLVIRCPQLSLSITPQALGIVHAPPVPPPTI